MKLKFTVQYGAVVLLFLSCLFGSIVEAFDFERYCDMSYGAVVQLRRVHETGEFRIMTNLTDNGLSQRRLSVFGVRGSSRDVASRRLEGNETLSNDTFYARECICGQQERLFCPTEMTACGIPLLPDQTPVCLSSRETHSFTRGLCFFLMAWIGLAIASLCFSQSGRTVLGYFIRIFYPQWNIYLANRMLRHNPDRANEMIHTHLDRRQAYLEQRYRYSTRDGIAPVNPSLTPKRPTSLVLKTTVFQANNGFPVVVEDHDDAIEEMEEWTCAICFASLEHGDRVGSLICNHLFHTDCLKSWLARRNVCPLCQTTDVATPCYDQTSSELTIPGTRAILPDANGPSTPGHATSPTTE